MTACMISVIPIKQESTHLKITKPLNSLWAQIGQQFTPSEDNKCYTPKESKNIQKKIRCKKKGVALMTVL